MIIIHYKVAVKDVMCLSTKRRQPPWQMLLLPWVWLPETLQKGRQNIPASDEQWCQIHNRWLYWSCVCCKLTCIITTQHTNHNGYNNACNSIQPSQTILCGALLWQSSNQQSMLYSQLFKSSMYYIPQIAGNEAFLDWTMNLITLYGLFGLILVLGLALG